MALEMGPTMNPQDKAAVICELMRMVTFRISMDSDYDKDRLLELLRSDADAIDDMKTVYDTLIAYLTK